MGQNKGFGERIGGILDRWWYVLAAILGGLLLAGSPFLGQPRTDQRGEFMAPIWDFEWVIIGLVTGAILSFGGLVAQEVRHRKKVGKLNRELTVLRSEKDLAVISAKGEAQAIMTGLLTPNIESLQQLMLATTAPEREKLFEGLLASLVGEVRAFLRRGDEKAIIRVTYYRLEGIKGSESLKVTRKTREVKRQLLDRGTEEGYEILKRTLEGRDAHCLDNERSKTGEPNEHFYACYASVSVVSDQKVYGMLSANTDAPGAIAAADMHVLSVVAAIIAAAESKLGLSLAPYVSDPRADLTHIDS